MASSVNNSLNNMVTKAQQTGSQMQKTGSQMENAGSSLKSIFAPAAVAVGAGFASAVNSAASFESKMSNVKALTGETGSAMTQLRT